MKKNSRKNLKKEKLLLFNIFLKFANMLENLYWHGSFATSKNFDYYVFHLPHTSEKFSDVSTPKHIKKLLVRKK